MSQVQSSQAKRSTTAATRSCQGPKKFLPTAALVASAKSGHSTTSTPKALGDSLSCCCGQRFTNAGKYLNHTRLCGGIAIQRSPVQPHLLSGSLGSPLGLLASGTAAYWREEQRKALLPKVAMRLPPQSPTAKSMLYCSAKAVALAAATDSQTPTPSSSHRASASGSIQLSSDEDEFCLSGFELQDDDYAFSSRSNNNTTDTTPTNNNEAHLSSHYLALSCFEPIFAEDFDTAPPSTGSATSNCGSD